MNAFRIVIVENEIHAAMELKRRIESFGYEVIGVVANARKAIAYADNTPPDLLLITAALKGDRDVEETASELWARYGIPSVYVTAAQNSIAAQLDGTNPSAEEPVQQIDLRTAIELALFRSSTRKETYENERRLLSILNGVAVGIIAFDSQQYVSFLNPIAELLTGWKSNDAHGAGLELILKTAHDGKSKEVFDCTMTVLREGGMLSVRDVPLLSTNNTHTRVDVSITPLRQDQRAIEGGVLVIRDASGSAGIQV